MNGVAPVETGGRSEDPGRSLRWKNCQANSGKSKMQ